jgi:hypothetical protein
MNPLLAHQTAFLHFHPHGLELLLLIAAFAAAVWAWRSGRRAR